MKSQLFFHQEMLMIQENPEGKYDLRYRNAVNQLDLSWFTVFERKKPRNLWKYLLSPCSVDTPLKSKRIEMLTFTKVDHISVHKIVSQ